MKGSKMNLSDLIDEKAKELEVMNREYVLKCSTRILTDVVIEALKFAQLKVINANIQPSRVDIDDTRHVQELVAFSICDLITELRGEK